MNPKTATVYLKRGRSSENMTFFENANLTQQYQMGGFQVCDQFVKDLGIDPPKDCDTLIKLEITATEVERYSYMKGGWTKSTGCVNDDECRAKGFKFCPYCGMKL